MKILLRYLFMNLLKPLLYLLLAFTMLFVIADLMDNADRFLNSNASAKTVLHYYSLQLPSMIISSCRSACFSRHSTAFPC